MKSQVEMSGADITAGDIGAVVKVLKSGRLSIGTFTERFERAVADYVGTTEAIAVVNGTSGLHLSVCAAGLCPGDEVVTTPFSFVASANCILYEGAVPRFADIDERTMNIDVQAVAAVISGNTRAVLPVHIFGRPCAMDELEALTRRHGLVMIEDACEAIGAVYRGKKVGSFGDAAVFSFYPNKTVTAGEGGMITTSRRDWAAKLRSLRNQGRNEMGVWLLHERLGFNYRLNEMSAALGFSQLSRIDKLLERRSRVAAAYTNLLKVVPGVTLLSEANPGSRVSWFVFIVRFEKGISRDGVIDFLQSRGVPTRTYFTPIHLQPYFQERFRYREGDFPVTERVARSTLALPFHSNMSEGDVHYVAACLGKAITASRLRRSNGWRLREATSASA